MTAKDKTSLPDLTDHMDKEVSQSHGNNTTKTAQHQQYQLFLYQAFTSPVPATCADCGKNCNSIDYTFFTRPDGSYCSAYLCSSCVNQYRQEVRP